MAFCLKDNAGGDEWKNIFVVMNASSKFQQVSVPEGEYTIVCADGKIDEQGLGNVSGPRLTVAPLSALIVHD